MPREQGKAANVRPTYKEGDRVLVELPSGYHLPDGAGMEVRRVRLLILPPAVVRGSRLAAIADNSLNQSFQSPHLLETSSL